ncbi:hypothetical protein MRB53_038512 [Persea americana]|nr:hypothetical protein MRB53_038512 [Persea americana]
MLASPRPILSCSLLLLSLAHLAFSLSSSSFSSSLSLQHHIPSQQLGLPARLTASRSPFTLWIRRFDSSGTRRQSGFAHQDTPFVSAFPSTPSDSETPPTRHQHCHRRSSNNT